MEARKFSIMLPAFNSMKYIRECVESILLQTYSNFTLHVVDGGSTDDTLKYFEFLNDKRIVIYPSERQLSIEENWQRFVAIEKDEYMTIIGHDDVYDVDFLSEINKLIEEQPEASLYHTHFTYIDKDGKFVRSCREMPSTVLPNQFLKGILTADIDIMATGFVMRSKDYDSIGGVPLFPKLLFADDALWLQLVAKNCLAVSPKKCFSFRYHQNTSNVLLGETTFHSLGVYTKFLQNCKLKNEDFKIIIEQHGAPYIYARCKEIVIRMIRKPLSERNGFLVSSIINGCKKYAQILSPYNNIVPLKDKTILMARLIDSNWLTRHSFILFKQIFKTPIVK